MSNSMAEQTWAGDCRGVFGQLKSCWIWNRFRQTHLFKQCWACEQTRGVFSTKTCRHKQNPQTRKRWRWAENGLEHRQTPNMDSFPGVQCPPQQWIWNLSQGPTANGTDKLGDVRSSCRHLLSGEKHPQDSELSWNMWSKIVKLSEI